MPGRRERASQVRLHRPAPQQLVVGRHQLDRSQRVHPALHRRGPRSWGFDEAFGDASHLTELRQVALRVLGVGLEREAEWQAAADLVTEVGAGVDAREAEHGVPFAGEAFVELDDRPAQFGVEALEPAERFDQIVLIAQVLKAVREGHPDAAEQLPAAALRSERRQGRIARVHGEIQPHRQASLGIGGGEARHVRALRRHQLGGDAVQQAGTVEDLRREWSSRAVVTRQQAEAALRMTSRNPGQQVEVVVDDRRVHRLAGHVDDLGAGEPQQHEHAQHPLLVVEHAGDLGQLRLGEAEAGDHDHRAWLERVGEHPVVDLGHAELEAGERSVFLRAPHGRRRTIRPVGSRHGPTMAPKELGAHGRKTRNTAYSA